MAKVSVIIPIYNVETFLAECLDSIVAQTYRDIEIILVDDGSTDTCPAICDSYAEKDNRMVVIHQENLGLSGARNTGIEVANGKWVTIVDGDDWLEHDAIEKMVREAEKDSNCDVLIASYFSNYRDKEIVDSFFRGSSYSFTRKNMLQLQMSCLCNTKISKKNATTNVGVTWARLYKREFLETNQLTFRLGLKRMQDAIFHLTAFEYAQKVRFVKMPVYHYRIWRGAGSRKYSQDFDKTAEIIIAELQSYIKEFDRANVFEDCYQTKVAKLFMEIIKSQYAPTQNPLPIKERVKQINQLMERKPYEYALKKAKLTMLSNRQKIILVLLRMGLVEMVLNLYINRAQ